VVIVELNFIQQNKNEVLIPDITWSLGNMLIGRDKSSQETTYSVILFIWDFQNRKYRETESRIVLRCVGVVDC